MLVSLGLSSPLLAHYNDEDKEAPNVEYIVGSTTALDFKVIEFTPKANPNISCVYIERSRNISGSGLSCYRMEVDND